MLITPSPGVLDPRGRVTYSLKRRGRIIESGSMHNDITIQGKNDFLSVMFGNAPSVNQLLGQGNLNSFWWIGLVDGGTFAYFTDFDTLTQHAGWHEYTDYFGLGPYDTDPLTQEHSRCIWLTNSQYATGNVMQGMGANDNTLATFNNSAPASVAGMFLTNSRLKGGTDGVIWATALFPQPLNLISNDILNLIYSVGF
jgi:hypothetical protein